MANKKEIKPQGTNYFWIKIIMVLCVGLYAGWIAAMHIVTTEPVDEQPERACETIERHVLRAIVPEDKIDASAMDVVGAFMHNARMYAQLIEVGCPENTERFRTLAVRQLDIALALGGDIEAAGNAGVQAGETAQGESEVVSEARRIMRKARRLEEPALQFIGAIERAFSE